MPCCFPNLESGAPHQRHKLPQHRLSDWLAPRWRRRSGRHLLHSRWHSEAKPAIANTWTWFSEGVSTYNALQVDLRRRFSHGLTLRGVYTFSKALDDGDSLNQTTANNAPGLVSNPFDLAADKGLATFDVRHIGVVNLVYELPFGRGRQFASDYEGWTSSLIGGWAISSIITAQSGFPITPQLSYNPSNIGRHTQSGSPLPESRLHRPGRYRQSQSVVQSRRIHRAAIHQRFLRQSRS